jgi:ribosomal-protein-alanine N-acetyltransferase
VRVLETERLLIEPLTPDDAAFMLGLMNDPAYISNIRDRGIRTLEKAEEFLRNGPLSDYEKYGMGMMAMRLRDSGETIGICGLNRRLGRADVDIGYALLPQWRGAGFALEAAQAVFRHAIEDLGLKRIVGVTARENGGSIKLLEKLGLAYEGETRLEPDAEPILQYAWEAER